MVGEYDFLVHLRKLYLQFDACLLYVPEFVMAKALTMGLKFGPCDFVYPNDQSKVFQELGYKVQ